MTTAHPSNYTRGRTQRIEFLVLHYTAGRNDSAAGNLNYFRSPRGASAHYFVDRNGWLQSVDDGDTAWAVGTAGVYRQKHPRCHNGNSISIEMCCRYENGRYWLEDAVVENAALLTRTLMRTYQIPIGNGIGARGSRRPALKQGWVRWNTSGVCMWTMQPPRSSAAYIFWMRRWTSKRLVWFPRVSASLQQRRFALLPTVVRPG